MPDDVDAIQLVWMVNSFNNQISYSRMPFLARPAAKGSRTSEKLGVGGDYFWLPNLLTIDARSNGVVFRAVEDYCSTMAR